MSWSKLPDHGSLSESQLPNHSGCTRMLSIERFLALVSGIASAMIQEIRPADVFVTRIDHWFDHKWFGFSGKMLGALGTAITAAQEATQGEDIGMAGDLPLPHFDFGDDTPYPGQSRAIGMRTPW